jgi:hypothetical protein
MALFTIAAALFFTTSGRAGRSALMQNIQFFKNMAIAGGLLSSSPWSGLFWARFRG